MSFLMGLNDTYSQVHGQLLLMDPLLAINKVFSLVSQEETQRTVGSQLTSNSDTTNTMAFVVNDSNRFVNGGHTKSNATNGSYRFGNNNGGSNRPITAHNSGSNRLGNTNSGGPNSRGGRPFCTYCNFPGHVVERCYKLHGYPPGYRQKSKPNSANSSHTMVNKISNDDNAHDASKAMSNTLLQNRNTEQCQQLMSLLSNHLSSAAHISDSTATPSTSYTSGICSSISSNQSFSSSHLWLVDFGASCHICSHSPLFTSLTPIHHSTVTLPNHTSIPVSYSGDIIISHDLILKDVLYVPQFHFNLISVSAIAKTINLIFHFFPDCFTIKETQSQRMIGKGNMLEGLYVLDTTNFSSTIHVHLVSAQTWHNRLGHISSKCFDKLRDKLSCTDVNFSTHFPCYICPLAKQRRLPFVSHNNLSSSPFYLIHCDIWGPFHLPDQSGHMYFLTLVDDCTRFTWLSLLKHKSNVSHVIPHLFKLISTQFNMNIKAFRSDNAKELLFHDFFC